MVWEDCGVSLNMDPTPLAPGIKGAKALVTGASSGLGMHFARLLARHGAHVVVAARRHDKVEALASEIINQGGAATALEMDVSSAGSVEAALDGLALDIVVNNAGTTRSASALDHEPSDLDAILDTNLKGVFYVAQAAAKGMIAREKGGSIINVASILGSRVAGHAAAYAASKGGVLQLTRSLALEWARYGIRVNAMSPGYIETDLNRDFFATDAGQALIKRVPQRRLGQPQDLEGPLLLLASDMGRFMTGSDVVADGGHLCSSL